MNFKCVLLTVCGEGGGGRQVRGEGGGGKRVRVTQREKDKLRGDIEEGGGGGETDIEKN